MGLSLGLGSGNFTSQGQGKTPVQQLSLLLPPWIKGEYEERRIMSGDEGLKEEVGLDDQGGGTRKKLRLTKDQTTVLEESFKNHPNLNQNEKQELADRLSLRPRQVEVWFQNRRARTKLKKTEVDCEFLKKCCERLSNENQRLKRELEELKSSARLLSSSSLSTQPPTRKMCPSCESITTDDNESS